jgi:hypothetical protein
MEDSALQQQHRIGVKISNYKICQYSYVLPLGAPEKLLQRANLTSGSPTAIISPKS